MSVTPEQPSKRAKMESRNNIASSTLTLHSPKKHAAPPKGAPPAAQEEDDWKKNIRKILENTELLVERADNADIRIQALEEENGTLKAQLRTANDRIMQLEEKANLNYLIVSGMPEEERETETTLAKKVNLMISEHMKLPFLCQYARRLGVFNKGKSTRPRPVRIYFVSVEDRHRVYRNKFSTPKNIFLNRDLPMEQRKIRKILRDGVKQAKTENKTAEISRNSYEAKIDGKNYHWSELLPPDDSIMEEESA
ncbi:unnamed protein product [Orchesella dallaii]|uniref:Uncharacterized protein n=1 Tax=Orchesella dallaii TaxID=48710 RepID=A0ABP1QU40_9HEXA